MRKIIYALQKNISLFILNLSLKANFYTLSAFILWLNIHKLKKIKHKKNNLKRILYFSKSGGNHDLIEAFRNYKNSHKNNIILYWIPRSYIKKIYLHYFKKNYKKDYFTKLTSSDEILKKDLYISHCILIFKVLNKFIKLDGLISFNIFYFAEKYLEELSLKLNLKFIVLHKESALSPKEEKYFTIGYKKYNDKSLATKISVYSESQKKVLIKSKIATKNQIVVNGCARSDYAFKLRSLKPEENNIVYFLIEKNRFSTTKFQKKMNITKSNWVTLHNQTLNYLIEYAKTHPQIEVILKGKTGVHSQNEFKNQILPKNIKYIYGGTGEKLLKHSKIVIGFNSTIVFEAIASNRNVIIPNFNLENTRKKGLVHQIYNKKNLTSSKKDFFKKLDLYLKSKYRNKPLAPKDKLTLNYYLGNTDGKSGQRLKNLILETI